VIDESTTNSDEDGRMFGYEAIRAKIEIGWQQSERGEGRDGEVVFSEIRDRLLMKLPNRRDDLGFP
jgi:hypothetical protein